MTGVALNDLEETLSRSPVIAIIRGMPASLQGTLDWLMSVGVRAVEVTTNTPDWPVAVGSAIQKGFPHVGVGTVITQTDVARAAEAGATFTVAPGLDVGVASASAKRGLTHIPGVATPTDIQAAVGIGLGTVKLFPAGPLGIDYLRALRGPFDTVRFVPTGSISVAAAADWMAAGAFAVGLGGAITAEGAEADRGASILLRGLIRDAGAEQARE